jgi:DNA-binding HxlR family transcriptional regulator
MHVTNGLQRDTTDGSAQGLLDRLARGNLRSATCPSRTVLDHLTSRWGLLVLLSLQEGTKRFAELRRVIGGVSARMLAKTLQYLEGDGLIVRTDHRLVPPKVEYALSLLGNGAAEQLRRLADWIESNLAGIAAHWPEDRQSIVCGARDASS